MSIRFLRFVFTLWIVPISTLLSAKLDEIESRMDQLLERLNKMEPSNSSQPVETPPIPLDLSSSGQDELPSIPLPPLLSHNTTASKSEAPKVFDQLEGRIDNLLRRLNMESSPLVEAQVQIKKQPRMDVPEPQKLSESENPPNSFALPDELGEQNFDPPPLPKNRFNFYLGLSIPGDSVYSDTSGNHDTEFGSGFELGLDYNRMFEDGSYIGAFVEGKFFDTEKISGTSTTGDNRLVNLGFTLGQDWDFSELLALKTQASIGASITHYEIDFINYSSNSLGFHYSFLAGLEFRWNEYWQTSLYYEFDGRSSADRMDYQSFHQLGIETGIGF
jgi:hypothetical protein